MKISEILEVNPAQDVKQDFNKGVSAVRKFTEPLSKVFNVDQKPVSGAAPDQKNVKDAVSAALQGQVYLDDVQTINKIVAGVKKGTYASDNPAMVIKALRAAANRQSLSQSDIDALQKFSQQFD